MGAWFHDVRVGARVLRKEWVFTAIVVLTLGLAIGVNTLIFCFANFFVFQPLPFREMPRQAYLYARHPEFGNERLPVAYADFLDWRSAGSFEALGAFTRQTHTLTGLGAAERIQGMRASEALFRIWGVGTVVGRSFRPEEDRPGAEPVVVLSHGFWKRRLGADPGVVGRTLTLDGRPHTVTGVLSPAIELGTLGEIDAWTPLAPDADPGDRSRRELRVVGILRPGATLAQAATEMQAVAQRQRQAHPESHKGWDVHVVSLRRGMTGVNAWLVLALLGVSVAFVLVIACVNVANLMLARATVREHETAVRLALGANRLRLVRQMLTESGLLATAGGGLGLLLAAAGMEVIRAVTYEPFFQQIAIDWRVIGFSAGIALLTPLVFGLAPAVRATRAEPAACLRGEGGRSVAGGAGGPARQALVVLQLGLALSLLVVAGLTLRSAYELQRIDLGFERNDLVTFRVDFPESKYPGPDRVRGLFDQLEARLSGLAQVRGVGAASQLPLIDAQPSVVLGLEGVAEALPAEATPSAVRVTASTSYFSTLGLALLRGRSFLPGDGSTGSGVAIVNEALARRYFADREAVGQRIRLGPPAAGDRWLSVVGVVNDVRNPDGPPLPAVYVPLGQEPSRSLVVFVRSRDSASVLAAARSELARLDPEQPLYDTKGLAQRFQEVFASTRLITGLFGTFAAVALILAGVGLYGVVSYVVSQRTREIGVRLALGAQRRDVLRMVMRQGLWLTALGLGLGLAAGTGLARAIGGALYGVQASDPWTLAGVTLTLATTATLASLAPALRATRIDPIRALHEG